MNNLKLPNVILYFCGIHNSHPQKYLQLHNELSKNCDVLSLIDGGKWGLSEEKILKYRGDKFPLENVKVVDPGTAFQVIHQAGQALKNASFNPVCVMSSNYRKGHVENADVNCARSAGFATVQISEMANEFYYAGADYSSVLSKKFESIYTHKNYGNSKMLYSNCLLWDVVDPGESMQLSREEFCLKYGLDPSLPVFVWGPDAIQCQHQEAQEVYKEVCKIPNVILKLHPNEVRRHKAERFGGKWSYELFTDRKVPVLDPLDTHWAFTYMDALINYQSTLSMEVPMYNKPTIYVNTNSENNLLFNEEAKRAHFSEYDFEWVGSSCEANQIVEYVKDPKNYQVGAVQYEEYRKKYLHEPAVPAYKLLSQQILDIL
tara:strand:+ start:1650 stop:2771 length:1122 start_codon:yes stop_codon:yes gene_type:complete